VKTDEVRYLVYARRSQPLDGLSPREQEIARALSTGKTFKSVARQCGIATSTVANHASRIYRKLGIYRREELFELIRASGNARPRAPSVGNAAA
jgi:DNA-binding NarL/FixJ family response regulator